eukprot:29840-Pelagococcus_subviridis.AAC.2
MVINNHHHFTRTIKINTSRALVRTSSSSRDRSRRAEDVRRRRRGCAKSNKYFKRAANARHWRPRSLPSSTSASARGGFQPSKSFHTASHAAHRGGPLSHTRSIERDSQGHRPTRTEETVMTFRHSRAVVPARVRGGSGEAERPPERRPRSRGAAPDGRPRARPRSRALPVASSSAAERERERILRV